MKKERKRNIFFLVFILFGIASCLPEEEFNVLYPKDYFPAYPASYWTYNNGQTVKVDPGYFLHAYEDSIGSNHKTDEIYVPRIDEEYVYEYSITQNSTRVPLKKLLSENAGDPAWIVDYWNGKPVYRKTVATDNAITLRDTIYNMDTTYTNVISVIEYAEALGEENWFIKEYYAQYIGLIRREVNNYQDTINPIISYDLVDYYINHEF